MEINENALKITKYCEQLRLSAYKCPAGVWTIGWGHTKGVKPTDNITIDQAKQFLKTDMDEVANYVNKALKGVKLTDNQFGAICDFVFNKGIGNFLASSLFLAIKKDPNDPKIPEMFLQWVYGGDGSHNGIDDDGDGIIDELGEKLKLNGLVTRAKMQENLYKS